MIKKFLKKYLILMLSLIGIISFAACGDDDTEENDY